MLFLKPTTSYAFPGEPLVLPSRGLAAAGGKHGVHHELELAVIVGEKIKGVADVETAMRAVAGYVLALDITERDEQTAAKIKGMPWTGGHGSRSLRVKAGRLLLRSHLPNAGAPLSLFAIVAK